MRLRFGPEEEKAFAAARGQLVGRYTSWLDRGGGLTADQVDEARANAELALDWKWSYADGDLGWWRTEHVAEFLLEWCPRKLSATPADCEAIPRSVATFVGFLDATGLLAEGSSQPSAVEDATYALTAEFLSAMGDPSNFGLAKSLFAAANADGVDLTEGAQMEEWIAEFNSRSEADRQAVLPGPPTGRPHRPVLPPVALPTDEQVLTSRAQAPILGLFAQLAAFVGDGRKLTQKGNLTLADARALVELLGTGDPVDERIGDHTFKTRSAAELPRLRQVFAWAKRAGVVRVASGKVVATKRGLALPTNPARHFDRALDALMAIGPLSSQRIAGAWLAWPQINELLDRFVVPLLSGPYVVQRPVPIDDIAVTATHAVLEGFEFPSFTDEQVGRHIATDVVDIMDALELAGVVRRADLPPAEDTERLGRRRPGGTVELTPAGVSAAHRLLLAAGYDAPSAGRFAEGTATELLTNTDLEDFPTLWGELEAWRKLRTPDEAVSQLADAAIRLDDPALRNLALAIMADIGVDTAEAHVRKLTTEPAARGFALCWLADHGLEPTESVYDSDDPATFVDVLAFRLVGGGIDAMLDTLLLAGNHDQQIALLDRFWRSPSTATETVLATIGETHPAKAVAKASRKALFRRRSWIAQ